MGESATTKPRWNIDRVHTLGCGILVLGIVLRVAWMVYMAPFSHLEYEGYYGLAKGLIENHQLGNPHPSAFRLPGYPFFLAFVMYLGKSTLWLRVCNILLSTALVAATYALGRRCGLRKGIALVGAGLCAINPSFVLFSPVLASEHLFTLLLLCALIVLLSETWSPIARHAITGALLGLAILTRGEGLFYFPLFVLTAWMTTPQMRRNWVAPLTLSVACACILFPWILRNQMEVGPGVGLSSTGGLNFYFAHNDHQYGLHALRKTELRGLGEVERDRKAKELGLRHLRERGIPGIVNHIKIGTERLLLTPATYAFFQSAESPPWDTSKDIPLELTRVRWFMKPVLTMFYYAMFAGAVISLCFIRSVAWRASAVLWGMVLLNWVGYATVFWATPRYRYVTETVMCILAAIPITATVRMASAWLRTPASWEAIRLAARNVLLPQKDGIMSSTCHVGRNKER